MMARLLRLLCLALLCAAALAGWPFREGKTKPKSGSAKTVSSLQIGVKRKAPCERAAEDGDRVWVDYRGTLLDGGEQFDASCACPRVLARTRSSTSRHGRTSLSR